MAGAYGDRSLKETPTWAVALVSAVFMIISILIEHGIHSLGKWFQKHQKKAMSEALEKIKAELMLLGFISLLITAGTNPISKICIPVKFGEIMLPCKHESKNLPCNKDAFDRRKLFWDAGNSVWRRVLAPAGGEGYCSKYGKLPLMSESGVHQLHIFIFVLGVSHILYSGIAMALAQAKLNKWKAWELETTSLEYQFANDPSRFRFTHETSFVRRHTGFSKLPGPRWIVAFYRQFFASVTKVDYLTMRHGFINAHLAPNCKFNFHQYIKRSMEDDFKLVVGISVPLWLFAILFQLLNVYRWYTLYVISFLPPILILLIGAKLQIIIMEMAQQIQDRATIVKGVPVVEPSNEYFWLHQPDLILFLMHFTLFQNAFQVAYFLWTWYEFGLTSCFHENLPSILAKVFLGVAFQVLCSYITFPVYALVTQMGSHMKRSIFEEQIANALKRWKKNARERNKLRKAEAEVSKFGFINGDPTQSHDSSSAFHFLHIYTPKPIDIGNTVKHPNNGHCSDTKVSGVEGPSMASCGDCETRTTKNGAKGEDEDLETDSGEDSVQWRWSKDLSFSVKSAYAKWEDQSFMENKELRSIWKNICPPKVELFVWMAVQNCIASKSVLVRRVCMEGLVRNHSLVEAGMDLST